MTEEMVTISKKLYEQLCDESLWLACLEQAGVDNWEGYSYAQELLEEMNKEENE